jgi:peptidoglycan endopeptidase LytE
VRRTKWLWTASLGASLLLLHPFPGSAYQVQPGDSLWSISQQYGVSVSSLEAVNGLSDDSILQIGEQLTIPGRQAAPSYSGSTGSYTVEPGDTLWAIAEKYGTSVDALMSINHLDSDLLQIGQVLRVPGGGTDAGAAADTSVAPTPEVSRGDPTGERIAAYALRFVGDPYAYSGTSPDGFDCSGFVRYVFAAFGINLEHSSYAQWQVGKAIDLSQLQPGDLVFFNTYGPISHDGIYVGGGRFISATTSRGVAVESLDDGYWGPRYAGARRL